MKKIILATLGITVLFIAIALFFFSKPPISPPLDLKGQSVAKIIVHKQDRKMQLVNKDGDVLKAYSISLGAHPEGPKLEEGDKKTPEGIYSIVARNEKSAFHKSLKISYPNEHDKAQAAARNVPPGDMIMIHGLQNGLGWIGSWHQMYNTWTSGCIAVTNEEIDELWSTVDTGTPVEISP